MKKLCISNIVIIIVSFIFTGCTTQTYQFFISSGEYQGEYWPTTEWRSCKPEEVGMSSEKLYMAYEYAAQPQHVTNGLIVIKNGYIVGEEYLEGYQNSSLFSSYSIAKSFLSALIGMAINEGSIKSLDSFAYEYLPSWQVSGIDYRKKQITIRHLLAMSSGIEWNEDYSDPDNDIQRMVSSGDYLNYMLNKPMQYEPWIYWEYNTGNSVLLSGILQNASGVTTYNYGRQKMFNIIGTPGLIWHSDEAGRTIGGWGVEATVRDYAKFGYLFLKNGEWDGQQVVPQDWVSLSTTQISSRINFYALHWWLLKGFEDFEGSGLPENIILAIGIHGQIIYIIPDYNIVIVKVSYNEDPTPDEWDHIQFLTLIINSLE